MDVLGPKYKEKAGKIVKALKSKSPGEIIAELSDNGYTALEIEGEIIELSGKEVVVHTKALDPYHYETVDEGKVFLDMQLTDDVLALGIVRDVVRRIQEARKKLNLEMMESIEVMIDAENRDVVTAVKKHEEYVRVETRANNITYNVFKDYDLLDQGDIEGVPIRIGIKKVE